MNSYFSILLILATFSSGTFAFPKPNDLKEKSPEDNEIPLKKAFGKGVAAEWGGYRASAGLGGGEQGSGLFARAEAPGTNAGAGVYSGGAGAGAGVGGPGGHPNGGFFDKIFAIPINVLHSVNTYVKTKNDGKGVHVEAGHGPSVGAGAYAGAGHEASAGAGIGTESRFADSQNGASASASASAGGLHHGQRPGGKPDYDKIFNIPITALKSVNDFLNG